MKRLIYIFSALSLFNTTVQAYCYVYSCDATIKYAIGRYSNKTLLRLNDFKRTIEGLTKSEVLHTKITIEQNRELAKLYERTILENMSMHAIAFEAKRSSGLN